MASQIRSRPKRSLRVSLIAFFLLFSMAPLAFFAGVSLVQFEEAIDQELLKRLEGNAREVEVELTDLEKRLEQIIRTHVIDKSLIFHSANQSYARARDKLKQQMASSAVHKMYLFDRQGLLRVALFKQSNGKIRRLPNLEESIELAQEFTQKVQQTGVLKSLNLKVDKKKARQNNIQGQLEMTVISPIESVAGVVVGYLEETINLDQNFLKKKKDRMKVELLFFKENSDQIFASHQDLIEYNGQFFQDKIGHDNNVTFEINLRERSHKFLSRKINLGSTGVYLGVGATRDSSKAVLDNVSNTFMRLILGLLVVLILLSFFVTAKILKPINNLLLAIQSTDFLNGKVNVKTDAKNELGTLTDSFNEMSKKIYNSQQDLKSKIKELESANIEIKETQARLVHAGKMASLGQLVAGVAHELNNPIGFIYSNMTHLRDYSEKLVGLVNTAESAPKNLKEEKEEADFNYIVEDMPRLISSCEDGARRTRDIVIGLRNFSRLEEASLKEIDLEEGLKNTLRLLSGELKNRVQVKEEFSGIPDVVCYPSQLNQVFMNILSNAAQAIEGSGEIWIRTMVKDKDHVQIEIEDTGKGMDEETRQKIFDPFFTTKGVGSGTGLGLSISYGVIEKHNGEILVESEPGKGTKFTLILPIAGPEA